jgi:DNA invertase Pin-like site-specific DNA recombinase
MKKAVLYARVSSDLQKKERTIESQIAVLKSQIKEAGDVLVKEYIDDGYSGARLDRPALDELRRDLKIPLFDSIYFLNTDRIARDVTYQIIIISEILKQRKQLIINGRDYVENPENKFTLTVLGAVAELERAKIIERASRGRQQRLSQGYLLGCGNNLYGYDYHRRTPFSPPGMTVNEIEAQVVRHVFAEYAQGGIGMPQITRRLEDLKAPTKKGRGLWRISTIKQMLRNETYTGVRYFNTMRRVREYVNPLADTSAPPRRFVKTSRNDWVGIPVPIIISRELFDKVQERLEWNRTRYRHPKQVQLLSTLIRCGSCGGSFFAYRRYRTADLKTRPRYVRHTVAYRCNWRRRQRIHSATTDIVRCQSKEIRAELLEAKIFEMIETVMIEPNKLRKNMAFFTEDGRAAAPRRARKLERLSAQLLDVEDRKKRIIEVYASGDLSRDAYIAKSRAYDAEAIELRRQRWELMRSTPLLDQRNAVDAGIAHFCDEARTRLARCRDSKRQFLLDYVEKITFADDDVTLYGSVPIKVIVIGGGPRADTETGKLQFCISDRITPEEKLAARREARTQRARRSQALQAPARLVPHSAP